jgi:hypothetical protein
MIQATAVTDEVYDAIPFDPVPIVPIDDTLQRQLNHRLVVALMCTGLLLVASVTTAEVILGSNGNDDTDQTSPTTFPPTQSLLPSPASSQSVAPIHVPSLRPTLQPSRSISLSTSIHPSTSQRPTQTAVVLLGSNGNDDTDQSSPTTFPPSQSLLPSPAPLQSVAPSHITSL